MHQQVDAQKTSWLATIGCCAPPSPTYNEFDSRETKHGQDGTLVSDQPPSITQPTLKTELQRPPTSYSISTNISSFITSGRDLAHRASTRASTVSRPWIGRSQTMPTISGPTDFRQLDDVPKRRHSFRPLELSIYMPENRLSPLPDFNDSDWTQLPADLAVPAQVVIRSHRTSISSTASSYRIQRKPVRSSMSSGLSSSSHSRSSSRLSMARSVDLMLPPSALQPVKETSASSSPLPTPMKRACTSPMLSIPGSTPARAPSPVRARSNTEPSPRKRPSLRSARSEIDEAIRELNTIIEERRADAYRSSANSFASSGLPPPSPSQHVPAIAPFRRLHVRSETLSDIGSAFSSPLVAKPLPATPTGSRPSMDWRRPRLFTSALSSRAATYASSQSSSPADDSPVRPRTSSSIAPILSALNPRFSLWLRKQQRPIISSSAFSISDTNEKPTHFYQCQPVSAPMQDQVLLHRQQSSLSSVSTFSTTPPTLLDEHGSITSPTSPPTPRGRSLSLKSGKSFGKWRGEALPIPMVNEMDANGGRDDDVVCEKVEGEMLKVNPLRMNPKSPVGIAF